MAGRYDSAAVRSCAEDHRLRRDSPPTGQTLASSTPSTGAPMDPGGCDWLAPFHIAEKRDKAREKWRSGMQALSTHQQQTCPASTCRGRGHRRLLDEGKKSASSARSDDAIAQIRKLQPSKAI